MAWMFVVNGASLRVEAEDAYELSEKIESSEAFKAVAEKASSKGLIAKVAVNSDEDLIDVFVGKELLESRNVYQGETTVTPVGETAEIEKDIDPLIEELTELLMELGCGVVEEGRGIVINVFD